MHQQTVLAPELVIKRRGEMKRDQADEHGLGKRVPLGVVAELSREA